MRSLALASLAIICSTCTLSAEPPKVVEEFKGQVSSVTEGDMLQLMRDKETITIRLEGIDAPEKNQSFGDKAKAALAAMTSGKTVTIKKTSADKYGRIIGYVVADGVEVNAKLVEDGFAWHFKKYNDEKRFAELELQARQAKRGLWSEANPLPPWDYRALPKTPGASNPAATATDRK
jgi:endonuclease YncB( thermonuclease family)